MSKSRSVNHRGGRGVQKAGAFCRHPPQIEQDCPLAQRLKGFLILGIRGDRGDNAFYKDFSVKNDFEIFSMRGWGIFLFLVIK